MKKGLSLFLSLVIALGVCFSAPFTLKVSAASISSLTFELNSDGESYYVSDCNESVSGDLEIPSTYNGLPVTSIGDEAFRNCKLLTSITIPDSVTSIGNSAFYACTSLTSITIPDSVTSIGDGAFYNCTLLTSITIPNSVTSIGDYAFGNCTSLTSIKIDDSVTSIGEGAFYACTSLTSITIPDSVTSIGSSAFYDTAYYNDTNNWENDVLYIGNHLISVKTTLSGDYTIKTGTKCIGSFAFFNCTSLTSITIPDSVTNIGDYAFDGCTSLTSITIPDSVTCIGADAFYDTAYYNDTNNWENDVLYIGNHLIKAKTTLLGDYTIKSGTKCIGSFAFFNCTSFTSITIPDSVTNIGDYAFDGCTSLTSITIPDSVTNIGSSAFGGCTSLTSITIGDSVTSIGSSAFDDCTSLTSVNITNLAAWCNIDFGNVYANPLYYARDLYLNGELVTELQIPEGVTQIKKYAFYNCSSLKSITIPDSVTSIGGYAFYRCTSLTSVNITNLAAWCNIDFGDEYANPLYYARDLYLNGELVTELQIPEGVTQIKKYAFRNCTSLTSVTIGDSVTSIGYCAFYGCISLTSITIPDSVTSIGYGAFVACASLTSVNITNLAAWCNIDFGGVYANPLHFAKNLYLNKTLVKNLIIPEGVKSINNYAFYNCTTLTSITIPDSVTSIGSSAFSGCTSLTSITIPDSVTSIGSDAFYNCTSLTSITIPDSVTSIGSSAFYNTAYYNDTNNWKNDVLYIGNHLISVKTTLSGDYVIKSGTKYIGDGAFRSCDSLTSITIGDNVTSIGEDAFNGCTSLKYVFYPGSYTEWNKISIGSNNSKLTSSSIHYNTTEHSCTVVKNLPFFEGMEGSVEEICSVCGFINSSNKLLWLNDYITAVDTKNVVLDTEADMLLLDISACTDISDAIIEMDGYTITAIPNSSHGFIGTGSKLKVSTTSGTQVAEYTLVVRGDVNGDSVCDALDLMLIELARTNNTTLAGVYFTAANLSEDGTIDISDFNAAVNRAIA